MNTGSGKPPNAWAMLGALAVAQVLGMSLWFSATAAAPALATDLALSPAVARWLTLAVQAGFVAGTLASALTSLADLLNPRRLMFLGCLAGATANLAVLATDSPAAVIALRALTGAALACVYPPALKIAAGWFLRGRGLALGILVGALTLGTAFPYLLTALFGDDWRTTMRLASALAVAGGVLSLTVLRDGPHVSPSAPFNPRAVRDVLRIRHARLATAAYLGHMWELYAMWAWVGVLATASLEAAGAVHPVRGGAIAAFVAIGSGLAGCLVAGWLADRLGRARVAGWALATSGLCAAAVSLVFGGPPVWLYALLALWGFAVVADSAQFSALVSDAVSRDHVGTALTLQTCLGFLLTLLTIDLLPRVAGVVGWQHASWLLVPGPVAGLIALRRLR